MKLKMMIATAVIGFALCSSSYGQLLDRMLGRGGDCCEPTSCCGTPASTCGGGGGCLANLGGGMGGFKLFNRGGGASDCGCGAPVMESMGCGCDAAPAAAPCGCESAPAPAPAPCGCGSAPAPAPAPCGCGSAPAPAPCGFAAPAPAPCDAGPARGGCLARLFNRGGGNAADCGCGEPVIEQSSCGCEAAPAPAPCGCDAAPAPAPCGCDAAPARSGCKLFSGGLLGRIRGRGASAGDGGCGCGGGYGNACEVTGCPACASSAPAPVSSCGCDGGMSYSGTSSYSEMPSGGSGTMMTAPIQYNTAPVEATPQAVPSAPTVPVAPVEAGSGARNIPRAPVVDPNAFIIRGSKYAGQ